MENPQQEAIGHPQGRLRKEFARLDFQILLTPFHSQMGQAQLLWGFNLKIMGVQILPGVLENLWGVLLLVRDWWGNGNCHGVFFRGVCWRGQTVGAVTIANRQKTLTAVTKNRLD